MMQFYFLSWLFYLKNFIKPSTLNGCHHSLARTLSQLFISELKGGWIYCYFDYRLFPYAILLMHFVFILDALSILFPAKMRKPSLG